MGNLQKVINDNKRDYLSTMSKNPEGLNGFNRSHTERHEDKKYQIARKLLRHGHTIMIEPTLKNKKQPDILVLDVIPPIAYEIAVSESDKSLDKKEENYLGIKIKRIRI